MTKENLSKKLSFKGFWDIVNKSEKQKAISEEAFEYASIKTREDADEFLKKQVKESDLRGEILDACNDNYDVFNVKMFEFLSKGLKKEPKYSVLEQTKYLQECMIQSDQKFCEPAIGAGIKLLEVNKVLVSDARIILNGIKDKGNFNKEELSLLNEDLPDLGLVTGILIFLTNRGACSKNEKGDFKKEAFDLYNKLYSKLNDPMARASATHGIRMIVSNCYVNGEIDKKLSGALLKACKDKFNSSDIEKIIKLINEHLKTNQSEVNENGIKFFRNLEEQGLTIAQCTEVLDSLKNPDGTHSIEAFSGFQILRKGLKLHAEQAFSTVANCKDNKGFFQKGLYDYAEKNIRILTNSGKYEPEIEDMQKLYLQMQFAKTKDQTNIDENKAKIVDDVISNYGYCFSDRRDILCALGTKHFESNFEQFKKLYSEETNSEMSARNKLLMGLNQDQKFDPQLYEKMQNLKKEMLNRKTELRYGNDDLSDYEIEKSFEDNVKSIIKTVELLGPKGTTYLFKYKLDGFEDYVEKISDFSDKLYKSPPAKRERVLKLINPNQSEEYKNIDKRITKLKSSINQSKPQKLLDLEKKNEPKIAKIEKELKALKQQLIKDSPQFEKTKKEINEKNKKISALKNELKTEFKNSVKVSPKIYKEITKLENKKQSRLDFALREQDDKINAINILDVINFDKKKFRKVFRFINSKTPKEREVLKEKLGRLVFSFIKTPYDKDMAEKLNLASNKYLGNIFAADEDFKDNLRSLVEVVGKDSEKSVGDALNELESNRETKKQFEANGINYEKWVNVDKNSYLNVTVETDIEKAKQNAVKNLENDLNDPLFGLIPKEQVENIFTALENAKIEVKDNEEMTYVGDGIADKAVTVKRLYFESKPLKFENLDKALNAIKEEFNKNEFWSKELDDEKIVHARDTIYTHIIKMRIPEAGVAKNLKTSESVNLEVHKTDMNDISHSLFLGNHANCCTAVENTNGWSAPKYIKYKLISGIEIMDKNDFVGNTMCYFAKVDGELTLVLDNIEVKTKYQYNDKIKNTLIDYAKKLVGELGRPDIPIYAGPNSHKVDMSEFPLKKSEVQILGSTDGEEIYLDYDADSHEVDGEKTFSTELYKLRG